MARKINVGMSSWIWLYQILLTQNFNNLFSFYVQDLAIYDNKNGMLFDEKGFAVR